ncbi:unnamed protein product [Gongylonema pulchrum]|uniref:EGF-like domain-containing protein n=1 Tax=Gongylonema pulchrum TaxID=637853 RepID=A0A183DLI9_9BILA|nr:unnamed protein product [Gongylonema pulchrum]
MAVAGFSGELCEIGSIDCQVQGCSSGERCVVMNSGTSYCAPDPCVPNPCQHDGTCTAFKDSFECTCPNGYEGKLCSDDVDECAQSPCKNGAVCVNSLGSFTCLCKDGFRGQQILLF